MFHQAEKTDGGMWKPPERIRHFPETGAIPNRKAAENALLFQPVNLGPIKLKQRTWVPAMVPWRAGEDGFVTPEILDWYRRFAEGRPGAIVVEATGIRDIPSGPLLRIGHDRFLPGLKELVEIVHDASAGETRIFIQIIDFLTIRKRPKPEKFFAAYLKITDRHRNILAAEDWPEEKIRAHLATLPDDELENILDGRELESLRYGYREQITDMHLPHIATLPDLLPPLFAAAASRAKQAGFDGVELHYAHAYTMASFLSATNDRKDGYGGSREGRARLPLEVYSSVRKAVGGDFAIGCRFLADDCIEGGSSVGDAAWFGVKFARAGMDFLSTSRGGKFDDAAQPAIGQAVYPYTGRSGYECMPHHISDARGPFGRNIGATATIRKAIRDAGFETPVVVTGGIHNFQQAEKILQLDQADIIGAARQSLADPDWFYKLHQGRGGEIRQCEYTNYCEGLDQKHKQVTCKLWDRADLSAPEVARTKDGKRRLTAPSWNEV